MNNDGYFDLAISDNSQLGGSGKFKMYLSNNAVLNTTPFWTSTFSGYGSGINLVDIDNDSDQDLITGGWWQPVRIYLNNSGNFNVNPEYTSTSTSVVEVITCGDVDNDAVQNIQEIYVSDGLKKLIYLPRTPLQYLNRVIVGPDTLQYDQYCFDLENGWVMLTTQPVSGTSVAVETAVSWDIDMGITNWDQDDGNYLFLNTSDPIFVNSETTIPNGFVLYQNYPNPFNPTTKIKFEIPGQARNDNMLVTLKVYDVLGNEVATLVNEEKQAGVYEVEFSAKGGSASGGNAYSLSSGIYLYKLQAGNFVETKKMILIK